MFSVSSVIFVSFLNRMPHPLGTMSVCNNLYDRRYTHADRVTVAVNGPSYPEIGPVTGGISPPCKY